MDYKDAFAAAMITNTELAKELVDLENQLAEAKSLESICKGLERFLDTLDSDIYTKTRFYGMQIISLMCGGKLTAHPDHDPE
jgi:hypothetical protein